MGGNIAPGGLIPGIIAVDDQTVMYSNVQCYIHSRGGIPGRRGGGIMPGGGIPAAIKAPGGAINPCCALNAAAVVTVKMCINKSNFTCLTNH